MWVAKDATVVLERAAGLVDCQLPPPSFDRMRDVLHRNLVWLYELAGTWYYQSRAGAYCRGQHAICRFVP